MPSRERIEQAGGVSDDAVQAKTGKSWARWFAILDRAGARDMTHKQIVAALARYRLGPWWSQMVTVAYEQSRGLRAVHQQSDGFQISKTRTVGVTKARLYDAWKATARRQWLEDPELVVSKATRNRSLRIVWVDGHSRLDAYFYSSGRGKSRVTVNHRKLGDSRQAERMKRYWGRQLDRLQAWLAR